MLYQPKPYPRMLYKNPGEASQVELIVDDAEAEHAANTQGWAGYDAKPEAEAAPPKRAAGRPKKVTP